MASSELERLSEVIPQNIINISEPFVELLKAYYEFLDQDDQPSEVLNRESLLRDVTTTTEQFVVRLFNELGSSFYYDNASTQASSRAIIENISTIYNAKGSLASITALFKIIFNEDAEYYLPREFMLRPSDGEWEQDYSITCNIVSGDVFDIIGEFVNVTTQYPGQPQQTFKVEVTRAEKITATIAIIYISRFSISAFYEGSTITFGDVELQLINTMDEVLYNVDGGTNFEAGDLYDINYYVRNDSLTELNTLVGGDATYQPYIDRISKYYSTQTSISRYIDTTSRINKYGYQTTQVTSTTDGLTVKNVTRGQLSLRILTYGTLEIELGFDSSGNRTKNVMTNSELATAQSPLVDWDEMIVELIKVAKGDVTGTFYTFLTTDNGAGYARGDINNDGVIDIDDVDLFVRRLMGRTIEGTQLTWIQTNIETDLLGITYPEAVTSTAAGAGSATLLPILFDLNGGLSLYNLIDYGYGYPDAFISVIQPEDVAGDPAILLMLSSEVARSASYYNSTKGFLSDNIKLQDNVFYQDFSYVIRTGITLEQFNRSIKKSVHPAGMAPFNELLITNTITIEDDASLAAATDFIFTRQFFEFAYGGTEKETWVMTKPRTDTAYAANGKETYDMSKPRTDTAYGDDLKETYDMSKPRTDTAYGSHNKEVYDMSKPRTDTAYGSHNKEVYDMSKPRTDTAYAANGKETYDMNKPLAQQFAYGDDLKETYDMNKPLAQQFAYGSHNKEVYDMSKPRTDTAYGDDLKETYDMNKPLAQQFAYAANGKETYDMNKPLAQQFAYAANGKETYDMNKPLAQQFAYAANGKEVYTLDKVLTTQIAYAGDDITNDLSKPLSQEFAYASSGKETYDMEKSISQEFAYASEVISIAEYIYYVEEGYVENTFDYVLKFNVLV